MRFALISASQYSPASLLGPLADVSGPELEAAAYAWRGTYADVVAPTDIRVVTCLSDLTDDDWPFIFAPTIDVPADLAYHFTKADAHGVQRPYGLILADDYQSPRRIQQAGWHEMVEAMIDAPCDRYDPDGYSVEVADFGQEWPVDRAAPNGVSVLLSPWAGPAWFGLGTGPLDSAGLCTEPHQILDGGYAQRMVNGRLIDLPPGYKPPPSKAHQHSRRSKRRRAFALRSTLPTGAAAVRA